MEVGDTVPSCERSSETHMCCGQNWEWQYIDNLEIHFERSTAPIFIHTSLAGMNPSCQVSLLVLHEKVHVQMLAFALVCLSQPITSHSLLRGGQPLQPALEYILEELY